MKIGIIGAGAAGLAAAYDLSKNGHSVTVYESAPFIGGQASTIEVGGGRLERGYHHVFTSDTALIHIMGELGIGKSMCWLPSSVGTFLNERLLPTTTPLDLLRFNALSIPDRLRLGLSSLRLKRLKDWQSLENFTADEWLSANMGGAVYETLWKPLLRSKFGRYYDQVGMPWFWAKIQTRFASRGRFGREVLGYPSNSFDELFQKLQTAVESYAGRVIIKTPVTRIVVEDGRATGVKIKQENASEENFERFDAILATAPSFEVAKLAEFPQHFLDSLRCAEYLAAVVLILEMNRPLTRFYWINIADLSTPFLGLIEQTNLVPKEWYGGRNVLYVTNYLHREDPLFKMSPDALLEHYMPHFRRFNPKFEESWIEKHHYNAVSAAQPVAGVQYSQRMPSHITPIKGLYLANTTQVYPEDRGVNYSIEMGRRVAALIPADAGKTA